MCVFLCVQSCAFVCRNKYVCSMYMPVLIHTYRDIYYTFVFLAMCSLEIVQTKDPNMSIYIRFKNGDLRS